MRNIKSYFFCRKSLQFFRGTDYDITQEISEIIEKNQSKIEENKGKSASGLFIIHRLKSAAFFKPFSIIGVLFALQEASGVNSMLVYLVQILEISGSNVEPKLGTIVAGVCRLVTAGSYSIEVQFQSYSTFLKKLYTFKYFNLFYLSSNITIHYVTD